MKFDKKVVQSREFEENLTFDVHVYTPVGGPAHPSDDIFQFIGCDYATSVLVSSQEEVDDILNLVTEEGFSSLTELGCDSIQVIPVNGYFLVGIDTDYINVEVSEYIESNFIVFGSNGCDDGSLIDILPAVKYMEENNCSLQEFIDIDEDDFDDDEYETASDFIQRIFEYQEEIPDLEDKLSKALNDLYDSFKSML